MIRKIIRIGNSYGVTIPAAAMRAHKLNTGDRVEVLISPPGDIAKRLEFLQELDEFHKSRRSGEFKSEKSQPDTLGLL